MASHSPNQTPSYRRSHNCNCTLKLRIEFKVHSTPAQEVFKSFQFGCATCTAHKWCLLRSLRIGQLDSKIIFILRLAYFEVLKLVKSQSNAPA